MLSVDDLDKLAIQLKELQKHPHYDVELTKKQFCRNAKKVGYTGKQARAMVKKLFDKVKNG
jgi:hypothetical protein